jgi:hypothetical protein
MSVPTSAWSESSPAGSDQINAGDNSIRLAKTQIREVIDVDHDFPSSGQAATTGQHKQVTLQEQADIGSGAEGVPILGAQTIDTKPELVYTDEDDNDIQMTIKGTPVAINGCDAKTTPVAADLVLMSDSADSYKSKKITMANLVNFFYPVGSYYFNDSVSTNPGTLFGVGTWLAVEEVALFGYKAGSAEFGTAGATGGAKTVAHTHSVDGTCTVPSTGLRPGAGAASTPGGLNASTGDVAPQTFSVTSGAASDASNLPPYRTTYIWRRSA